MMRTIIGKTAPKERDLFLSEKHFDMVEIQLLQDYKHTSVKEVFETIISSKTIPISVHAPLVDNETIQISRLVLDEDYEYLRKTFELASLLASWYNVQMPVVVHFASDYKDFINSSDCEIVVSRIDKLLREYRDVEICIENSVPILRERVGDSFYMQTGKGFRMDNVYLAKYLRDKVNETCREQIKVTIDTCHIYCTEYIYNILGININTHSVEDFFRVAGGLCRVVHFNNAIHSGIGKENHSAPFIYEREEDRIRVKEILSCIDKYCEDAIIVLEINEDDYSKDCTSNKVTTLRTILKLDEEMATSLD